MPTSRPPDRTALLTPMVRRLHRTLAVAIPIMALLAMRSGVAMDRPGAGTAMLLLWPAFVWGSFARDPKLAWHAGALIGASFGIVVATLADIGISPGAASGLCVLAVLVGIFFGSRAAWVSAGLVFVTYVVVGAAFSAGWLSRPDPAALDVMRGAVWLRLATTQAAIAILLTSAVTRLLTELDTSIEEKTEALRALRVEQERRYEEARMAIRMRDEFLAIAGHELRTPLTPLLLEVQGLERQVRNGAFADRPGELERHLQKTSQHVLRVTRLVDELLDVSHVIAGKLSLSVEEVDLTKLAREVLEQRAGPLARSGSAAEIRGAAACVGMWDRGRLEQVVTNLVDNAIKYGAGRPIEITIDAGSELATLTVRDHGIGIDAAVRDRVFGRFERATSTEHYGGFGLGLWLVKQIVDAAQGTIRFESEPGEGTTFVVELPRGQVRASREPNREEARAPDSAAEAAHE